MKAQVIKRGVLEKVSAASAVEIVGDRVFVVGDDAVFLYVLDRDSFSTKQEITLLPIPKDTDGSKIPKAIKPDFECLASLPSKVEGCPRIAALGSGSKASGVRDGISIIEFADSTHSTVSKVTNVSAKRIYDVLRADADVVGGAKLNLEGATLLGKDTLLLMQRGNVSGHNTVITFNASSFEAACNAIDSTPSDDKTVPEYGVAQWKLPQLDGWDAGLSGVSTLDFSAIGKSGDYLLFSASYEATRSEIDDGDTLGSIVGLAPIGPSVPEVGRKLPEPFTPQTAMIVTEDGSPLIAKVEGIALLSSHLTAEGKVALLTLCVTDPDGAASEYVIVRIETDL